MSKAPRVKSRKHGFIGRIHTVISDDIGFIRPGAIQRMDGGTNIGLDVDDDLLVHRNAFDTMEIAYGYAKPERLYVGMIVAFFIGPSANRSGRLTAEGCSVYRE